MDITRAARTVGDGPGSSAIVRCISRRIGLLNDAPGGVDAASHQRRHHAGRTRAFDGWSPVLYAIRNGGYSRRA